MFGKKKKHEEPGVSIDLPIIPMLDMSFQLMSFFILTFKPTPSEGQMSMYLPKLDDVAATAPPDQALPDDTKVDEYTIRVGRAEGDVGQISFKRDTGIETLAGPDYVAALRAKLKSIPQPADSKKKAKLTIEAPDDMKYSALIRIMDACKLEGYESVGVSNIRADAPRN
jgi:biopolymer transport protein ExbD